MKLPSDHPQRIELNNEVHARPPEPLAPPSRLSYLALLCDPAQRDAAWEAMCTLCRRYAIEPPGHATAHYAVNLGPFRLKWERHMEFVRFIIIAEGLGGDPFERSAISLLPEDWVATLPGQTMMAAHAVLLHHESEATDPAAISLRWFAGNVPIGSAVSGGSITALTDFRIHADGFSRHVLLDHGSSPWQAGRVAQQLLEVETYRILALLAFPLARSALPLLTAAEAELTGLTAALIKAQVSEEPKLLHSLTQLEAEIEHLISETRYRFDAAAAYHDIVHHRIDELHETRIPGLQTFREFTDRRLAPAMATCRSVTRRQDSLSERLSRAATLMETRVAVTRERQNQTLLESINRRARLQLRMQSTVEGLLVAAVTYYVCGLVGRAAEALLIAGVHVRPELATGISIPIVGLVAWLGLHHVRRVGRGGDG